MYPRVVYFERRPLRLVLLRRILSLGLWRPKWMHGIVLNAVIETSQGVYLQPETLKPFHPGREWFSAPLRGEVQGYMLPESRQAIDRALQLLRRPQ